MVRDQLQRYVGHQVLKQPADDLVAVSWFDIPHVDERIRMGCWSGALNGSSRIVELAR